MIKTEIMEDGRIRTYSDAGKRLIQVDTGLIYDEAVDIEGLHTYTESEQDIESPIENNDTSTVLESDLSRAKIASTGDTPEIEPTAEVKETPKEKTITKGKQ